MKISAGLRLALGLTVLTLLRLCVIGQTDPIPDETYYFSWAKDIQACYWDQPAGVAVVNALAAHFFGRSVFGLRLSALLLSLLSSYFLYDLGRSCLGSRRRAAHGVLLAQIVPILSMGAVIMLHDTVMGAAAVGAMAFAARAILRERPLWWYPAALAGVAALYAKFSAILLAPGLLIFCALSPKGRRALRRPELYLAAFAAVVLFSPVIVWNYRNGWVAYYAVAKLSGSGALSFAGRLLSLGDFILSQAALVTPILLAFMAWACVRAMIRRHEADQAGRLFLASMTLGIFGYFLLQALRAKVQGNWAALAYLPASLLAADIMAEYWERRRVRKWAVGGIIFAAVVTLTIHVHTIAPFLPIPAKIDPTAQAHGWKELADRVREEMRGMPPDTAVMARRYQVASELEFHLDPEVEIYCASYSGRGSQYDLRQSYEKLAGRDVVYVDFKGKSNKLFKHFQDYEELAGHDLGPPRRKSRHLNLFVLRDFRMDGPLEGYFADPFGDALARLKHRVKVGRK